MFRARGKLLFACCIALISQLLHFQTCHSSDNGNLCAPSSCGNIQNISYPFRLDSDPKICGNHRYNLSCDNNSTVLYLYSGKYYVQAIHYDNFTIRVVDAGVQEKNCSSLPLSSLTPDNFTFGDPYTWYNHSSPEFGQGVSLFISFLGQWYLPSLSHSVIFMSCANAVNSPLYIDSFPCLNYGVKSSNSSLVIHSYLNIGGMNASDLMELCSIEKITFIPNKDYKNMFFKDIHSDIAYGFELSWFNAHCENNCSGGCYLDDENNSQCIDIFPLFPFGSMNTFWKMLMYLGVIFTSIRSNHKFFLPIKYYEIAAKLLQLNLVTTLLLYLLVIFVLSIALLHGAKVVCGTPITIAFLIYKWRRRHLSAYDAVEEFLQNHVHNMMPVRYSYSDIKKMTEGFKDKLGEGGYGSVYKGKLRSGRLAAIKILDKSKANGQDFINEVATIGRIHHTNVVQLIGFCAERSKRALVYDFMSRGSLNNFIFSPERSVSLSWEKLYEISLGVARGIEYLHQGCEMQILHFDIKPHNILLDEDFTPKVSDFGLSRLYPANESIPSLTAARGTIGYMAPELFYKNIGRVSYKADVYSFGMLLLDMAGKRKNLNALAEKSSEIYWPLGL